LQAGGSIFSANSVGEQMVAGGTRAAGLGGGGYGLSDSIAFNSENPALAAFVTKATFRVAGQFGYWQSSSGGRNDTDGETVWKDLRLYLPMSSKWRLGFGAEPRERVDLNTFGDHAAMFGDTSLVHYEERNVWQGGNIELRIDNAFLLGERAAVGVGMVYSILDNSSTHTLDFDNVSETSYYRDAAYGQTETYRGWTADVGAFWQATSCLGIGAAYRPRASGNWTFEFEKNGADSLLKRNKRGELPGHVLFGLSYLLSSRVIGVADMQLGQWKAGDLGAQENITDTRKPENPLFLSVGIERMIGRSVVKPGLNNWGLRGGLYYRKHYWPLENGSAIEDLGVSLGVSAPLSGSQSFLHWAIELGKRGMNENKLGASETFIRSSLEIEVTENWFVRTRPRIPK